MTQNLSRQQRLNGVCPREVVHALTFLFPRGRLANNENFFLPKFKNMEAVGNTSDTENARGVGQIIGSYLAAFGFTLDFAPVVDVNTNPENIVIGARSFGSDPKQVADMAGAFLSGLHSTGVKGCIKHFPGHGDTKGDTHADYVAVTKSWEELKTCEIIPFKQNLSSTDCVMIAHVTCTAIDTASIIILISVEIKICLIIIIIK